MNNTLTTWRFLIKMPYLGKLSDAENKGLSHFSSDENKGLESIAEIRCSVMQPLITDGMYGVNKTGLEVVFTHAPRMASLSL